MGSNRLLSVRDAAKLLNVHSRTIYRLIEKEQLPAFNLGGKSTRLFEADVRKFIEERRI